MDLSGLPEAADTPDLFRALGDPCYTLDRESRFTACDEAATYLGQPAAALIGRSVWEAFPAAEAAPVGPLLRRIMADRRPLRAEMAGAIRPERWVEFTLFPIAGGLCLAFRDRTAAPP